MARQGMTGLKKDALVEKYEMIIQEKSKRVKELEKKVRGLEQGATFYNTDENVTKKILSLRSKNYSPDKILDTCQHIGIETNLKDIKNIVNNIDELDSEYIAYYKECVESYEKQIKINPAILKQSSLDDIQFLIDTTKEKLSEVPADNLTLYDRLSKRLESQLKIRNDIIAGTVLKNDEEEKDNKKTSSTSMKNFDEKKSKILSLHSKRRKAD